MAGHEYAKVNVAIWGDQDWKKLTRDEHWLYFLLWSHPKTNAAGVADWRPGRLASSAAQTTAEDVRRIAAQLQAKRFILVDEESEEVLIRSYLKHDQRMKQPNASVSVANAYSGTASLPIQKVIVYELGRLKERQPSYKGWESRAIQDVLSQDGRPIDIYLDPSPDPSSDPSDDPRVDPSVGDQAKVSVDPSVDHPLTETYTETLSTYVESSAAPKSRKKPETPIPDDWTPTEAHAAKAKEKGVHLETEAENFKLHAQAHDRRLVNWNAGFSTWLNKARPSGGPGGRPPGQQFPPRQSAAEREMQIAKERHERIGNGQLGQPLSWDQVFQPKQIEDAR